MKKIFLLLIILNSLLSSAETQKDSLFSIWDNKKLHDTIRLQAIQTLAWDVYLYRNPDSSLLLSEQQYSFAEKSNNIKMMAYALKTKGVYFDITGEYEKSITEYQKSQKLFEQIDNKKGIASCLANIGYIYRNKGLYKQAIDFSSSAMKIFESLNNKRAIASMHEHLGTIHYIMGNYDEAEKHFLNFAEIYNLKYTLNIGNIYSAKGEDEKALEIYLYVLDEGNDVENPKNRAICELNIGVIYANKKEYKKALTYFEKVSAYYEEVGNRAGYANILHSKSSVYFSLNNMKKTFQLASQSFEISKEIKNNVGIKNGALQLYNYYKKINDKSKALDMFETFIIYRDSLENEDVQKEILRVEYQYEYEKQKALDDKENEKLLAIEQEEKAKQKVIIYAVIGGALLLVMFLIFIFNRLKVTRKQKEIIAETNEELNQTNEEIAAQRDEIEKQKEVVEEAHNEVKASINYAERIQKALLSADEHWKNLGSSHFILFKPRDVVSGDFYWAYSKGDNIFWAAADCTGHGVPGAFMSMLGVGFLNEIVAEGGETESDKILNKLRNKIIKSLEQKGSEAIQKDGMDIALCVWNKKTNNLQFSGAYNSLLIIREGELIQYKANKQPIGKFINDDIPFTKEEIQLIKGDMLYTFSDGYSDQFGGELGRKFMSKQFKNVLLSIQNEPMQKQHTILNQKFEEWMKIGNTKQIDDVCVIGVKV